MEKTRKARFSPLPLPGRYLLSLFCCHSKKGAIEMVSKVWVFEKLACSRKASFTKFPITKAHLPVSPT
ncbi:hypothetical protein OPV22_003169 [Ensete ventricosum]|uniref:Secreted protein n=1 Tax=Ensete ventricosum TaxID=4639 RepID=A0AAV8S030_ENSVE|nr:hypothetical protein OPV22_003169 [Ensete ventricosum]